ncbi:hypothetical protein SAMN05216466_13721 [Paraburkholderia phenazinium]|uniref:Uncharacterized protein n=1 Tax=Paraburkholderia phenazinium TaxID=60549 RepID=A0A1G8NT96_9BURK|nr:hypothetical protein SAMN05216466_13721 [Paraburkholderia phenazinium]
MHSTEKAKSMLYSEVSGSDQGRTAAFLARYCQKVERCAELTVQAIMDWQAFDEAARPDEKRGRIIPRRAPTRRHH